MFLCSLAVSICPLAEAAQPDLVVNDKNAAFACDHFAGLCLRDSMFLLTFQKHGCIHHCELLLLICIDVAFVQL